MKTKILSAICHLLLAIGALAQTTTLTVNTSTGKINVPTGVTPYFDVLNVAGVPVPLVPTPAQYGATNDGTLHPVSEWIPSRYQDITAVRTMFGSDVQTTDSVDRIVIRYLRQHYKTVVLPPNPNALTVGNGYYLDKPVEAYDDGQQTLGLGRNGPYGTADGTLIVVAPGIDGLRHSYRACSVRDLTIRGSAVSIHSITTTGGAQAILQSASNHGLSSASINITNTTGTTTYSNPAVSTTVTSASAHGLTSADFVRISGSSETGINGIWRVRVLTATTFKLLTTDQGELGVPSAGTGGSFQRVYEVGIGPDYTSGPQAAVPSVVGIYHVTASDSTHLNLWDEDNNPVVLTTNATNDTGTLYLSRHLIHFGSGDDFDNTQNSPDPGHSYFLQNLFAHDAMCGIYTGLSDAGSGEALVVYTCAAGFWIDGAIDNTPLRGCWATQCFTAGYRVTRGTGLVLEGNGGAFNKVHVDLSRSSGSRFIGLGNYFEGLMRTGPAPYADGGPGTGDPYIEVGGDNRATVIGMNVEDGVVTNNCHFHTSLGSTLNVIGCQAGLHAWQKGASQVYGDDASGLVVSYQGITSDDYSYGKYQASDAFTEGWGNSLPSPTLAMIGKKIRMIPSGGKVTEAGLWICENTSGSPTGTSSWRMVTGAMAGKDVVTEGDLSLSDVTTANASTTKHGFLPKLPNDATKYLDGTGAFSTPAGGGSSSTYTAIKTSGTTRTSTTTFADDSDLVFASLPTGWYQVDIELSIAIGDVSNGGLKWQFTGTATEAGATGFDEIKYFDTFAGLHNSGQFKAGNNYTGFGATTHGLTVHGFILITASGSFNFQWAQQSSSANGTQLQTGSRVVITKVANYP